MKNMQQTSHHLEAQVGNTYSNTTCRVALTDRLMARCQSTSDIRYCSVKICRSLCRKLKQFDINMLCVAKG